MSSSHPKSEHTCGAFSGPTRLPRAQRAQNLVLDLCECLIPLPRNCSFTSLSRPPIQTRSILRCTPARWSAFQDAVLVKFQNNLLLEIFYLVQFPKCRLLLISEGTFLLGERAGEGCEMFWQRRLDFVLFKEGIWYKLATD